MEWKLDDSRPIWPQLKEQLVISIVAGEFEMGSSFPTVRELAEDAGVNRNTMQRALSELENDGFVITNRTAGRTVTTDEKLISIVKDRIARQNVDRFFGEMEAIGYSSKDVIRLVTERGEEER